MAARIPSFLRRLPPRGGSVAGLLALLILVMTGSALSLTQRQSTTNQQTPTPIPTPTPTPTPTPIPPPLVYLTAHGNPNLREIALTFDDGPSPDYTKTVLSILREHHILATFFMLGVWVQRYPDLAREVVDAGHAVGDHSWNHPDLTRLSASQIRQQLTNTRNIIQQITGVTPYLFRPPYEAYNKQVLDIAHSLNLSTILWNIDPRDWARPGSNAIINNVLTNAHNGSIILLHDGGGNRSQTVAALTTIIEHLQGRGFTFVTIPQMLMHLQPPNETPTPTPTPGEQPPGHPPTPTPGEQPPGHSPTPTPGEHPLKHP